MPFLIFNSLIDNNNCNTFNFYLGCFTDEEQSRALAKVPTDLATIRNLSISSSLNLLIHPSLELAVVGKNENYDYYKKRIIIRIILV